MVDVSQGLALGLDLLPTFVANMDNRLERTLSKSDDGMKTLWYCQNVEVKGCLSQA